MAETENIARLAEIVSDDLFARFFWATTGARNQNWPCELQEHAPRKSHPSDVVFYYEEPYSIQRTYINCDLKSYASGSITIGAIASALKTLADSLTCAETSDTWRKMYVHDGYSWSVVGLLFVYNHDGEYDTHFDRVLSSINQEKLRIPKGSQIAILGPQQIRWLDNIRREIVHLRGLGQLPSEQFCHFSYPNLVRKIKVQVQVAKAATLEMLTGPWITMGYESIEGKNPGYLIFYRGRGETTEEFLYLIDYLMHYQMIKVGVDIKIRTLEPDPASASIFQRAIEEYIDNCGGGDEIATILKKIDYRQMDQVFRSFSQIEVGMSRG
jgi:hypothetical protein